jgi:hypothetical protein
MNDLSLIDSAINLAKAILATDALEDHKRGFLHGCVWTVTQVQGKYIGVRYWSEGVFALVEQNGGEIENVLRIKPLCVRHEHVNTRKSLVEKMMKDHSCVEEVLRNQAIACLVTIDEHKRLKLQL